MNPNMKEMKVDMVPELTRKHFEEALKTARTSVTRTVINKILINQRIQKNLNNLEENLIHLMLLDKELEDKVEESKLIGHQQQIQMFFKIKIMQWNKMMIFIAELC